MSYQYAPSEGVRQSLTTPDVSVPPTNARFWLFPANDDFAHQQRVVEGTKRQESVGARDEDFPKGKALGHRHAVLFKCRSLLKNLYLIIRIDLEFWFKSDFTFLSKNALASSKASSCSSRRGANTAEQGNYKFITVIISSPLRHRSALKGIARNDRFQQPSTTGTKARVSFFES